METTKVLGRPKGPEKVVYKRNVDPKLVNLLDEVVRSDGKVLVNYRVPAPTGVPFRDLRALEDKQGLAAPLPVEAASDKGMVKALLDDVERMAAEIKALEAKIQRIARLTDDERLILWIRKYDLLKAEYDKKVGGSEHSQA